MSVCSWYDPRFVWEANCPLRHRVTSGAGGLSSCLGGSGWTSAAVGWLSRLMGTRGSTARRTGPLGNHRATDAEDWPKRTCCSPRCCGCGRGLRGARHIIRVASGSGYISNEALNTAANTKRYWLIATVAWSRHASRDGPRKVKS
jgi:hypothetical protein